MRQLLSCAVLGLSVLLASGSAGAERPPISLSVDVTNVLQGIQRADLVLPVSPGPLALAYPKWVQGEHAATGPLTQVVGLEISAGGRSLPWRRDLLDPFVFHLDVPKGESSLRVRFDYLSPARAFGFGYGRTPNVTPHLLVLPFNHVLLTPRGAAAEATLVRATVRLPAGWKSDGALRPERVEGATLHFPVVSVETLVDSPLLAGEFFRTIPLTGGEGATRMSIAADAPADLAVDDETVRHLRQLVAEAQALFGARHYREYVWLVALSNRLDWNGLEHHESTDVRGPGSLLTDPAHLAEERVLPHEYVHSWNGKHRRPAGLATRNGHEPLVDDLLWVYEGMTRYLGDLVLRGRSGLRTPAQQREYLAWVAAVMDRARPGRAWRTVGDTATALPGYIDAPAEWVPARRMFTDYYDEMLLVWLEADTILRKQSGGTRSLDDFCRSFFGGASGGPTVRAYARADVVAALGAIAPWDWAGFLASRVDDINPRAPLDGIRSAGWKLVYDDTPNEHLRAREKVGKETDLSLSLGFRARPDGTVADVVHGSPAFAGGVAPAMKILAIGGHKWSAEAATGAIRRAARAPEPIELILEAGDLVRVVALPYHDGLRYPHLVRDDSNADLLSEILRPLIRGGR